MILSWFMTTIAVSFIAVAFDYVSNFSASSIMYFVPGLMLVLAINVVFWLPVIFNLNKKHKITLGSSVISSLASASVGCAIIIGVVFLLLAVNGGEFKQIESTGGQPTRYTSWTIGHIHYLALSMRILVLWAINGVIFWKLYGRFATNKAN